MDAAAGAVAAAAGSAVAGSGEIPWLNVTGASFVPSAPEFASHAPKLLHLVWASSCLSILGAGFIVLSYWLFPDSRKVSRTILMFLSIADLGSAGTWVWSTFITTQLSTPSTQCVVQGFVLQFFYLSSYVWTSCFAFHLFQLIWKRNSKSYALYYHIAGWGIPLTIDVYFMVRTLLGRPSMGNTQRPWCWISSETSTTEWSLAGSLEQLVFFYLPLLLLLVYNMAVYLFLVRRGAERLSQSMEKKIRMRLLLYLVVFFVCSIWGLVNRILQMTNTSTHQPPEQMEAMEAFFSPLQGFLNAIVYGLNVQLRDRYLVCCGCKRPPQEQQETPMLRSSGGGRDADTRQLIGDAHSDVSGLSDGYHQVASHEIVIDDRRRASSDGQGGYGWKVGSFDDHGGQYADGQAGYGYAPERRY